MTRTSETAGAWRSDDSGGDWERTLTPTAPSSLAQALVDQSILPEQSTPGNREKKTMSATSGAREFLEWLADQDHISGAAYGKRDGTVKSSSGQIDAEMVCAATAMMRSTISDAVEILGLGDLQEWCVGTGDDAWYVYLRGDWSIVAAGEATARPDSVLTKAFSRIQRGG